MTASDLWSRYRKYLSSIPAVGLTLDVSRMKFDEAFLAKMEPAIQTAYTGMDALEKGAIANPDDQIGVTHNDGKYFAYIAVGDNDITKRESANPVKTLRMRYNAWVKAGSKRTAPPGPSLYSPQK